MVASSIPTASSQRAPTTAAKQIYPNGGFSLTLQTIAFPTIQGET